MSNFPAFPFEYHNQTRDYQKSFVTDKMLPPDASEQYSGLTARDYFAAKAIQGFCSSPETLDRFGSFASASGAAFEMADAMLAARETV